MASKEELDNIIEATVSHSDGSFHMCWADGYDELTVEEQRIVDDAVYAEIVTCDCCGWNFNVENLEAVSTGEMVCWSCASNYEDEESGNSDED